MHPEEGIHKGLGTLKLLLDPPPPPPGTFGVACCQEFTTLYFPSAKDSSRLWWCLGPVGFRGSGEVS